MNNETIPGVIPLIQRGLAIYKEEFNTLVGLNALYVAFTFMGLAAFFGSLILAGIYATQFGDFGFGLMTVLGVIVLVLFWWLLLRIILATLYTIRDYDEHLTIREAFARGRGQVLPFLWVILLTFCAVIGSLILVFIAGSVILFPFYFVVPDLVGVLVFLVLWIGSFLAVVVTGTWFAFTTWLFVDQDARGLHALAVSKHLSHNHLGAVMWRIFCFGLLLAVSFIVVQIVVSIIFSFLPYEIANILSQLITNIIVCLTLVPILYASMFSLYISAEANQVIDTDSKSHGEHRGILITLVIFGFLAICLLPTLLGAFGAGRYQAMSSTLSVHNYLPMQRPWNWSQY